MEEKKKKALISWNNIEEKDDFIITYLLYKEGKNIELISRIRNLNKEVVKDHIIRSKAILNLKKSRINDNFFVNLLASKKEDRLSVIRGLNENDRKQLIKYLSKKLSIIDNAEDKMIALWIAGELEDNSLLPTIHNEAFHKHGGVRRMVCSALGKIGSVDSLNVLHKCLQDGKPQVRQYASNSLRIIGNEKTIKRLKNLLNNPKEVPYVRKSYEETIEIIENRLKMRKN